MDPVSVSIVVSAPREQVFDYLQDIANHPEFTDHFLVEWHLTRIDSVGRGAGARFRVKAPGNRFSWADVTFVGGGPPPPDRRDRAHRQGQPGPHARRLRAGGRSRRHARDLHVPHRAGHAGGPDRREPRRALVDQTQERPRAPAPAGDPRGRRGARAAGDRCRWLDCRLACDTAARRAALAALGLLAVLVLAGCGDSHSRVTTGTYAGESGANAPYLDVGPLIYEVQISRQLNPWNNGDSTYLQGVRPRSAGSCPGRSGSGCSCRSTTKPAKPLLATNAITLTDTQGNVYRPIPIGPTNLFAYRGGSRALQRHAPDPGHPRPRVRQPGSAAAVQDRHGLARQPPAGDQNRQPAEPAPLGERGAGRLAQAGFQNLSGHGRGGVAPGPVFDEQHAHDQARVQRRREGREPGVGVGTVRFAAGTGFLRFGARGGFLGGALAGGAGALQFGGAGLARHRHAGDRRGRAGARRAPRRSSAAARSSPPRRGALPERAGGWASARKVGWGRCPPSAIVAATVAICRGVASTLP